MKTLLIIAPGRDEVIGDCIFYLFVAETGEVLASHLCSYWTYAMGDLYSRRPERIKEWTKRFGEVEVKYIHDTDISIDELMERNSNWAKENWRTEEEKDGL